MYLPFVADLHFAKRDLLLYLGDFSNIREVNRFEKNCSQAVGHIFFIAFKLNDIK